MKWYNIFWNILIDYYYYFMCFTRLCMSMKKYVLRGIIIVGVCLWRGTFSFAQTSSTSSPTCTNLTWLECRKQSLCTWNSSTQKCQSCKDPGVCCGIELNTNVPFIGKCIEYTSDNRSSEEMNVTEATAFPVLMWSLMKILITVILIVSFVLIIVGGILIATGNPSWGKKMIMKVVVGIAILWVMWVVLRLINPNFFG